MKIDRDRILAEALALLDAQSIEGLTTRTLAAWLGVRQPALYWHVKDRRAPLDAMNASMLAGTVESAPPQPGQDWQDHVLATGRAFRRALKSHRDGARLHAGTRADGPRLERQMRVLVDAGLPIPLAIQLLVSVGRLVVGWVLEEQAEENLPPGPQSPPDSLAGQSIRVFFEMGDDDAFAAGLRCLVSGAAGTRPPD